VWPSFVNAIELAFFTLTGAMLNNIKAKPLHGDTDILFAKGNVRVF
jgi:hypothetical protein